MDNNVKLIKTCNTARKVTKVVRIFSYVALALFAFVTVALLIPGVINMDEMTVEHNMTGTELAWGKGEMLAMLAATASVMVISGLVMLMCERVLTTVTDGGSPFVDENVSTSTKNDPIGDMFLFSNRVNPIGCVRYIYGKLKYITP